MKQIVQRFWYIAGITVCAAVSTVLVSRNTILEFKAAYFLPTGDVFKEVYGGGALYGPELTFQLGDNKHWYGFLSVDYFQKHGKSCGLCCSSKVSLLPLGIGAKYFIPLADKRADVYVGLGFQPVRVHTQDCSEFVISSQTRWGFGGIAKLGAYVPLSHNFVLDFFIDYSFVKIGCGDICQSCTGPISPAQASVSGVVFGAGLGYRF